MAKNKSLITQLRDKLKLLGFLSVGNVLCFDNKPGNDKPIILEVLGDSHENVETFKLTIPIQNDDDDLERIDSDKFTIMRILENCLILSYSETTNGDACSTSFVFDTNHANGPITIIVMITDGLS